MAVSHERSDHQSQGGRRAYRYIWIQGVPLMAYWGSLNSTTGELTNIRAGYNEFPNDVPLMEMPSLDIKPPYGYDAETQKAITLPPTLEEAQNLKLKEFSDNTEALQFQGFSYTMQDGTGTFNFPLDTTSKSTWQGMITGAAHLTYPLRILSTDLQACFLQSAAEVQVFYGTGLVRAQYILDGGASLTLAVMAATTVAEVNAITDDRV